MKKLLLMIVVACVSSCTSTKIQTTTYRINTSVKVVEENEALKKQLKEEKDLREQIYLGAFSDGMKWQSDTMLHTDSFHYKVRMIVFEDSLNQE